MHIGRPSRMRGLSVRGPKVLLVVPGTSGRPGRGWQEEGYHVRGAESGLCVLAVVFLWLYVHQHRWGD